MARAYGVQLCASSDGPPTEPMKSIDPRREREDAALGVTALELAIRGFRFPAEYTEEQRAAWSQYIPPAEWVPSPSSPAVQMRTLGSNFSDARWRKDMREPGYYTSQLGALGIRRLGEQYAHYFPGILMGKAWGDKDHRRALISDENTDHGSSRRDGLCVLSIDHAAGKVTFG